MDGLSIQWVPRLALKEGPKISQNSGSRAEVLVRGRCSGREESKNISSGGVGGVESSSSAASTNVHDLLLDNRIRESSQNIRSFLKKVQVGGNRDWLDNAT
jgi:hypothetical protein